MWITMALCCCTCAETTRWGWTGGYLLVEGWNAGCAEWRRWSGDHTTFSSGVWWLEGSAGGGQHGGVPLGELLLLGVEDEEVKSKYRGFIEKMWSKREEIFKMTEGQPAWCGEEKISSCCLCVVHRMERVKQQIADWRAKLIGEEIRRKNLLLLPIPYFAKLTWEPEQWVKSLWGLWRIWLWIILCEWERKVNFNLDSGEAEDNLFILWYCFETSDIGTRRSDIDVLWLRSWYNSTDV